MGKAKLSEYKKRRIVQLAADHWSQSAIARKYNIDHSTVFYHIKKRTPIVKVTLTPNESGVENYIPNLGKVTDFIDGDVPEIVDATKKRVKNYSDFVSQYESNRFKKQEACGHKTIQTTVLCKCCGKIFVDIFKA